MLIFTAISAIAKNIVGDIDGDGDSDDSYMVKKL